MPEPTKCVYCRAEPASEKYRPFCSERCKNVDFGAWASESYRVAAPPPPGSGASPSPDGDD